MSTAFSFPLAVPSKRHRADYQRLGDSACQSPFSTLQPEISLVPDKSSSISSGLPHSDSFEGFCSWWEVSQTSKTFSRAFYHHKSTKGCKNEKIELPALVSVSVKVSRLSDFPSSFLCSSTRPEGCLHFRFLTRSCESLQLTTVCAGGFNLLTVCIC